MAGYGVSYLTVKHLVPATPPFGSVPRENQVWEVDDGSTFSSEAEMLRVLGVTGWKLVSVRDAVGALTYYFMRQRS